MYAHGDYSTSDRTSVSASFDNVDLPDDNGHDGASNGSWPWDAAMVDSWSADDAFLDLRALTANLTHQNLGEACVLTAVDLADVVDGPPDASTSQSGTGTSSSLTLATVNGDATFAHSWSGSKNYAHIATSIVGTDGSVIAIDCLCVWDAMTAITIDAGATVIADDSHVASNSTIAAVVTAKTVAGGSAQSIGVSPALESSAAATLAVQGGGAAATAGEIGHWTDSVGGQIPSIGTYIPISLATEERNDGIYTLSGDNTLVLTSGGNYRITARITGESNVNSRANGQAKIVQVGGTSTFLWSTSATGYLRDVSEHTYGLEIEAYIAGASPGASIQLQWRADINNLTLGSVAGMSHLQVVRYAHTAVAAYSIATTGQSLGGLVPNTVGLSAIHESDTAAIELVGTGVELRTSGRWYEVIGSVAGLGLGARTQRMMQFAITDGPSGQARQVCYQRNSSNEYAGVALVDRFQHPGTDPVVRLEVFRGPSLAEGGGGDDGGWVSSEGGLCVIELPPGVRAGRWYDSTGGQAAYGEISTAATVVAVAETISDEDIGSFARVSNTEVEAAQSMDALVLANLMSGSSVITVGQRHTGVGRILIDGAPQALGTSYNFARGAQSTSGTHGCSGLVGGIYSLSALERIGLQAGRIDGGETGQNHQTQPGKQILLALDLGSLAPPVAGSVDIPLGAASEYSTASGLSAALGGADVVASGAAEIDAASPATVGLGVLDSELSAASESDSAAAAVVALGSSAATIGSAGESDIAYALTSTGAVDVVLEATAEVDAASVISSASGPLGVGMGLPIEVDTAYTSSPAPGAGIIALDAPTEASVAELLVAALGSSSSALAAASESDSAAAAVADVGPVAVAIDDVAEVSAAHGQVAALGSSAAIIGSASESSTAYALTSTGAVDVVLEATAEADAASVISSVRGALAVAMELPIEVDTAYVSSPAPGAGIIALDAPTEASTAESLVAALDSSAAALAAASESDSAAAAVADVGPVAVAIVDAAEVNAAHSQVAALGSSAVAVGSAGESDIAYALTSTGAVDVVLEATAEVDAAHASSPDLGLLAVGIGLPIEVDTAYTSSPVPGAGIIALDAPTEASVAESLVAALGSSSGALVAASESDSALATAALMESVALSIGEGRERDDASSVGLQIGVVGAPLDLATEAGVARIITVSLGSSSVSLAAAVELDVAYEAIPASALLPADLSGLSLFADLAPMPALLTVAPSDAVWTAAPLVHIFTLPPED